MRDILAKIMIFILLVVGSAVTSYADYQMDEDMNALGNDLYNATNVNSTNMFQDGKQVLDTDDINGTTFNYTNYANVSFFWDTLNSFQTRWFYESSNLLTFNETLLNSTIDDKIGTDNASMKSYVDTQDLSYNTTMTSYVNTQNSSMKSYVDTQDQAYNDSMETYTNDTFIKLTSEGNLNVNNSNSTDYWLGYNAITDLNYRILSHWLNITNRPTHLSNFTDDLGNRGYTALSNFTDDLGDRGYDSLSNFTNDIDLINSSYGNSTYILQSEEGNLNVNNSDTADSATLWASVSSFIARWFYDDGNVLSFNETLLNSTIDARENDTTYTADGEYLYLSGTQFTFNETKGNATMDARNTNAETICSGNEVLFGNGTCATPAGSGDITGVFGGDSYIINGSASGDVYLLINETVLNATIDARENDTTYSAGNGISLSTTTFSVAGNTALTQDADGLSVTNDAIGDTQLEYNTGQHLTTTSEVTHGNMTAENFFFKDNSTSHIKWNGSHILISAGSNQIILAHS